METSLPFKHFKGRPGLHKNEDVEHSSFPSQAVEYNLGLVWLQLDGNSTAPDCPKISGETLEQKGQNGASEISPWFLQTDRPAMRLDATTEC